MNKIRYKKELVSPKEWQVWLAPIRFEEKTEVKLRPVLIHEVNGANCSIFEITSQPPADECDVRITDIDIAGLAKESVIQIRKRKTIPKSSLKTYRGTLSRSDRNLVKDMMGRCR